jgi:hypothetical protein
MQRPLPFLVGSAFPHPTQHGERHYVPVIKTLPGEMRALEKLAPTVWERMTPLIEVDIMMDETDKPPQRSRLPGIPVKLARIFGRRPFFLDLTWLTMRKKVQGRTGEGPPSRSGN